MISIKTAADQLGLDRWADDGGAVGVEESAQSDWQPVSSINQKVDVMSKPVYPVLAEHQISEKDWEHHAQAAFLRQWWSRFNLNFGLSLPDTPLRLEDTLRFNCLGYFRPGYNEFGLRMEIAIARHGSRGDRWNVNQGDLLGTLLHEMLHMQQELFGKPGKDNYHNKDFQRKALSFGLIVDGRGHQVYQQESPFVDLLGRFGVPVPRLLLSPMNWPVTKTGGAAATPTGPRGGKSKLKLWMCACGIRVRVAVPHFRARCEHCRELYMLSV